MSATTYDEATGAAVRWIARNPEAWQMCLNIALQEAHKGHTIGSKRLFAMVEASGLDFQVSAALRPLIVRIMAATYPALAPYIRTKPLTRTSHR